MDRREGFCFFPFSVSEQGGADGLEGGGQLASVLIRRFFFSFSVSFFSFCFFSSVSSFSVSVFEQIDADRREGRGQLASVLIRRFTFAGMKTIAPKGNMIVSLKSAI